MKSPNKVIEYILYIVVLTTILGTSAYAQNRYENSANYLSALKAVEEDRFEDAYDYLNKEIAIHPDNGYAYILLASFYYVTEQYEKSVSFATQAINYIPSTDLSQQGRAYIARALAYESLQQHDKAKNDYDEAILLCPKEIEFLLDRANFFSRKEKYDESDSDYRRVLAIESDNNAAQIGLGYNKYRRGDYQDAISYFTRIIPNISINSDAYTFRAASFFKLEKYENSINDIIKALSIDRSEKAFYLLSDVASQCFNIAVAKLENEVQKDSQEPFWPFCIGILCKNNGKYADAISAFKKAYKLDENCTIAKKIADCYFAIGDIANANKYIDHAIRLNADDAEYYATKANICFINKDNLGALAQISIAIEKDGSNAAYYFIRGCIKEDNEDYDGAIEDYTECISLNGEFAAAYLNRGRIYNKMGYKDSAIHEFEKCVELNIEGSWYTAYALAYLNRKDEAIAYTQDILRNDSSASNLYGAACIFSLINEKETSIYYLEKAIKAGYQDFQNIINNIDLDNIRGEDGYKRIVAKHITKTEYIDESKVLKDVEVVSLENQEYEDPDKKSALAEQTSNNGKIFSFSFKTAYGVNKVTAMLNGLPITINFIDAAVGINISVYEANYLLNNKFISLSDIIRNDNKATGIIVGSTIVLHELVLGDITLTNVRAKVVTNDNVPFSFGLKVFSNYMNVSVQKDGMVTMNKK